MKVTHQKSTQDSTRGTMTSDVWYYRTEVLNAHLFESLAELRALTDAWLRIYNGERPHDSLGRVPPLTFLPRPSSAEKSPIELSA